MKDNKIICLLILAAGCMCMSIIMNGVSISKLSKENKELKKEVVEQQRIIESQADMLIDKENEKCPDWLENYYYDHVCEEGCDVTE